MNTGVDGAVALLKPPHLHLDPAAEPIRPVMLQTAAQLPQRTTQLFPLPCDHILIQFHFFSLSCGLNVAAERALPALSLPQDRISTKGL